MTDTPKLEPMLEMYIYETIQLIDRLEQLIMDSEVSGDLSEGMEEIFRIMHTIKGNSMMMMFEGIAELAHITEDLFDYLRKTESVQPDYEKITDLVLDGIDHIKTSIHQLQSGGDPLEKPERLIAEIKEYLDSLIFMNSDQAKAEEDKADETKQDNQKYYIAPVKGEEKTTGERPSSMRAYEVVFRFSEGCEMENIRAFSVVHGFKDQAEDILHIPREIVEDENAIEYIKESGFQMIFRTAESDEAVRSYFETVAFAENMRIQQLSNEQYEKALRRYLGLEGGEAHADNNKAVQDLESDLEQEAQNMKTDEDQYEVEDDVQDLEVQNELEGQVDQEPDIEEKIEEKFDDDRNDVEEDRQVEDKEKEDKESKDQERQAQAKEKEKPRVKSSGVKPQKSTGSKREVQSSAQAYISVGIPKVDKLMDLVGELVVSESMVTRNPDLTEMHLENFDKAVRQHRIIINELQDIVMSIRMMPLAMTFQKMNRLVRDMKKKVGKDIDFELRGQETEVDKNVIEQIGDPLMHIIRNSIDHGIESNEDRDKSGKMDRARIVLEAKHSGGDVWITVKDNGQGIDPEKILSKAENKGLLMKPRDEYSDKEIYNFLFHSGFSTKEQVTEFSGRGVGLDVVARNVEALGGTIVVDSEVGKGSEFAIRIPLTLAIIDGMMMSVGKSIFVLPITAIKESFSAKEHKVIVDPEGHEMCMIRGVCYPIQRLHSRFGIGTQCTNIDDGILIMTEYDGNVSLLFADAILGEQQVVVKSLSSFLQKVDGISGCALLGDGRISLILDPAGLVKS